MKGNQRRRETGPSETIKLFPRRSVTSQPSSGTDDSRGGMSAPGIPTDTDLFALPPGLPAPEDDGAARHLLGATRPHVRLRSTRGRTVDVAEAAQHLSVFFLYPATVRPGIPIPGEWSEVPGARGCTLQNCAFRDGYHQFRSLHCEVFGVSGQAQDAEEGLADQMEFAERVGLPFELLNDSGFELVKALGLPHLRRGPTLTDLSLPGARLDIPVAGADPGPAAHLRG